MMDPLIQLLRQAFKVFRNNPGFSATALLSLTIGIGANVAIFTIVNAVLLKPLPFSEPDRLVMLMISQNQKPVLAATSPAQYLHLRLQTDVLDDVAVFANARLNYISGDTADQISSAQVSEAYFRTFGARFTAGRGFIGEEVLPGGNRVAAISHRFWTQRLAGDPNILGKTISIGGNEHTVVGIVSSEFDMRDFGDPEVWLALQIDPNTSDRAFLYQAAARLKPGVTLEQAQARLETSVLAFRERFPGVLPRGGFSALPMQEAMVGTNVHPTLFLLLGAVGLVLLIACANVANLLLIHANGRRRELALRRALGAGRASIAKLLLMESLLLSLTGAVLGLVSGFLGLRALLAVHTAGLPRLGEAGSLVALDWRIVAFTLALSFATVLLFGLVPAITASRTDLNATINSGSRAVGVGIRQGKTRSLLVSAEVALAVVLLIGAGLLIRTSLALSQVDPGFDATEVLTMRTSLSGPGFSTTAKAEARLRSAREQLRSIPGVVDVMNSCCIPMQPGWGAPFNIVGRDNSGLYTGSNAVVFSSPNYFDIYKIPVLRGRSFNERDDAGAVPVAIINQALAKLYWPQGDPLADQIQIGGGGANIAEYAGEPARQIIGIVADTRAEGLATDPAPTMYVPQAQLSDGLSALVASKMPTVWVIRTQGPAQISRAAQEALRIATGLPVTDVHTMEQLVSLSVSRQRLHMLLMTVFGGAALLLAAVGVFGLMAYAVAQRTQEIGIRLAMGGAPSSVGLMICRDGMRVIAIGLAAGLGAAYFLAKFLASTLFGVTAHDPAVFVAIPILLALVALAAIAIPALRASRLSPVDALR